MQHCFSHKEKTMALHSLPLSANQFRPRDISKFRSRLPARISAVECIEWLPVTNGYAQFRAQHKTYRAHRVSYALFNGPVPANTLVCHSCDNRCCVNPKHLWLGTHKDNIQDCVAKGRFQGGSRCGDARNKKYPDELILKIQSGEVRRREALTVHGMSSSYFHRVRNGAQRSSAF